MSNSVRPHPWDSPGKNTGVGCHFLLQCRKVKSESEVAQPCLTLCNPMDCSLPGSSIHGILQARVLEWGAIAFSEDNSKSWDEELKKCFFPFLRVSLLFNAVILLPRKPPLLCSHSVTGHRPQAASERWVSSHRLQAEDGLFFCL